MNKLIFYFNNFIDSVFKGVHYITNPFEEKVKRGAILDSRLQTKKSNSNNNNNNKNKYKFYKTKRK